MKQYTSAKVRLQNSGGTLLSMNMPRISYIQAFFILFIFVSVGGLLILAADGGVIPEDISSRAYYDHWRTQVAAVGAEQAYASFVSVNQDTVVGEQHLAAHVIGDVLYNAKGLDGIVVCDASFGFGCFHGFFGVALAREGVDSVAELDAVCVEQFGELGTGCTHGIGHGVLEFFGYDRIHDALSLCEKTTQLVPILGCTSGVFMEYNTPLRELENGGLVTQPRRFDTQQPLGVCSEVADLHKQSCYFELGAWWALALDEDWKRMEALCAVIEDEGHRSFCLRGVGYALGNMSGYDTKTITHVCDAMGADARFFCRAGAHWMLYSNPDKRAHAPALCRVYEGAKQDACTEAGRPDLWVTL